MAGNIIIASSAHVSLGDPVALVADDSIGILEGITSVADPTPGTAGATSFLFRADADASLALKSAAQLRALTDNELATRNDAVALAAAQATFDAASTALTDAGGTPCP